MIIGLTGSLGAGKGTIVEFLIQKGFKHYSVRDFLIEEIKKRGLSVNRDTMVSVANQLRELNHPSYIVEQLYDKAKLVGGDWVIESLRTLGEIDALKQKGEFYLIAVDADPKIRYERAVVRESETDKISFEKFLEDEQREMFSDDPNKQNLSKCIEMADFILMNNGGVDELKINLEKVLEKIKGKKDERPSWDEYFMKMAVLVAERSTCLRHHVGAIVVKDKRVLTTGYNGAARGAKDCLELGCLRDEFGIASGTRHEICRAIHAEQNTIIQAGIHGISVQGGTMYCTHIPPCMICAKMIVNARIKEVVGYQEYADEEARKFLIENGVDLRKIKRPSSVIEFKD